MLILALYVFATNFADSCRATAAEARRCGWIHPVRTRTALPCCSHRGWFFYGFHAAWPGCQIRQAQRHFRLLAKFISEFGVASIWSGCDVSIFLLFAPATMSDHPGSMSFDPRVTSVTSTTSLLQRPKPTPVAMLRAGSSSSIDVRYVLLII